MDENGETFSKNIPSCAERDCDTEKEEHLSKVAAELKQNLQDRVSTIKKRKKAYKNKVYVRIDIPSLLVTDVITKHQS